MSVPFSYSYPEVSDRAGRCHLSIYAKFALCDVMRFDHIDSLFIINLDLFFASIRFLFPENKKLRIASYFYFPPYVDSIRVAYFYEKNGGRRNDSIHIERKGPKSDHYPEVNIRN